MISDITLDKIEIMFVPNISLNLRYLIQNLERDDENEDYLNIFKSKK